MAAITQGDAAPDLTFSVHTGEQISLNDYRGDKAVVIYKEGVVRHVFNAQLLPDQHVEEALDVIRGLV